MPTVDNPAPARSAAMAAMAADPAFPTDPPSTSTCPKFPLFVARGRGPIKGAMSSAAITLSWSELTMAVSGEPIGMTSVGPSVRHPKRWAGRGAVKVTMASARAIVPAGSPMASASAPEGMSTATTPQELAFRRAIAAA